MFVSTTAKLGPGGETNGGVVYRAMSCRAPIPAESAMYQRPTRSPGC